MISSGWTASEKHSEECDTRMKGSWCCSGGHFDEVADIFLQYVHMHSFGNVKEVYSSSLLNFCYQPRTAGITLCAHGILFLKNA